MAHRIRRTAVLATLSLLLAVLPTHRALADLAESASVRAAVAGKSDAALIAANPVLERLGQESPHLLSEVLERLRTPTPRSSHQRGLVQRAPRPATASETAILTENPDFSQLYRESPEAALDLLRLIREASKTP